MTEIKPNLETKWDILYDPSKKSLFSKLEEFAINNYFSNAFVKSILSITKIEKGKIFEPGSGGGMTCANFAQLGFEIISMDLSNNALRKGISLFKSLSLNAKFLLGDLFNLPIKDEQFDIVFNQGVMEHFRLANMDALKGVKEMLRVLKKEGTLIIFVPAYFSPLFFKLIDKYWPYTEQDFLHKNELKKMMIDAGCQNVTVKRMWSSFFFSMVGFCKK